MKGRERVFVSETNTGNVYKTALGILTRYWVERIWVFSSALYALEKAHMRSTPYFVNFPNAALLCTCLVMYHLVMYLPCYVPSCYVPALLCTVLLCTCLIMHLPCYVPSCYVPSCYVPALLCTCLVMYLPCYVPALLCTILS